MSSGSATRAATSAARAEPPELQTGPEPVTSSCARALERVKGSGVGEPTEAASADATSAKREASAKREGDPKFPKLLLNPAMRAAEQNAPEAAPQETDAGIDDTPKGGDTPKGDVSRQDATESEQSATPAAEPSAEKADTPEAAPPKKTLFAGRAPATDQPADQTASGDEASTPKRAAPAEAKPEPVARMPEPDGKGGAAVGTTIEAKANQPLRREGGGNGGGDGGGPGRVFHKRSQPEDFNRMLRDALAAIRRNLIFVLILTFATNALILAIPIYLFQISDRVLTSRSIDTLVMLTAIVAGAVIFQSVFDAIRRFMLMRTSTELASRLGAPILSAAAHASLHGTGREYQTLGDLQQMRGFLVSGTLISFLDVPFAPLFILAIFLVHPDLGTIVVVTALILVVIAVINQRATAKPFAEANMAQAMANQHLDSMSRNSQIINAMAMIPEAVRIWGRDTAASMTWQVKAQDRNVMFAAISRAVRLLTQIGILGWGAYLAIGGEITGGMVIAASIIAGRAFAPIEGSIEGWNNFILTRGAFGRVRKLLTNSSLQYEKLRLPRPEGRLDVERLLYVPGGTKQVVLNGISFSLNPGESLAVIGNSGAGKTTLGKTLVGSILPTSGSVRLDLMDIRNWDPRQFGESIGYLPQDVQLFPGTIKDNIGRMRADATDTQIHDAAVLADVHNMIATLPQGYETIVAADGSPLSGGQKQRIALARAFFGAPRMVVLDEPNSNLDVAGDKALARAIEQAKSSGITVVVITQKPTLLSVVDKIMLLTDGRVALFGEREKVLAQINGKKPSAPELPGQPKGTPSNA